MFVLSVVTTLGALSVTTARAQVAFTGQLDVNALQAAGQVSFSSTPYDIGAVSQVFDGQNSTLYRSANVNPAWIAVAFTNAQAFREFRVLCSHTWGDPAYQWKIETANTQSDLDAKNGSYRLAVGWTGTPSDQWSIVTLPATVTAQIARLTVQRLTGDNYVHIDEWGIYADTVITSLSVSPSDTTVLSGQTKQFTAAGTSTSGTVNLTNIVTWSSTVPAVASVSSTGLATAAAPGTTTIGATFSTLQGSGILHVNSEPTDLDVTYIQRTPQYDYDAAKNKPAPGDPVVFTAHVRNWGGVTLPSVAYRWELDGAEVASGTITSFAAAGSERTLTLPWTWQDGNHTVGFRIDPDNLIAEATESNNVRTDRVNSIIAGFWVEQSLYDYFHTYQRDLSIGSNSWDDWIQRQMAKQNQLYTEAIWPSSPQGVLDRVRIDKIVVVPDGALPLHGGLATNDPDLWDKTVDLMWGFPANQLPPNSNFYADHTTQSYGNPFYIETSLIHELGHARYLIDCYGFDVANSAPSGGYDQVQIWEGGTYVAGSQYMPFIAWDSVLYYNKSGGVMTGPYGFAWSPYEAAALNRIAGHRAVCGNYNAPCNIGEYLENLPQNNFVRFVDPQGRALRGADVRLYRAGSGPGWYGKTIDNTPDLFFTTDGRGYAKLPRNPFTSGQIIHTYGNANGVAVLRLQHTSGLWYRFLEVSDLNMEYWAGHTTNGYYTISLDGAVGCVPGDMDCDGDVDGADLTVFESCASGPAIPRSNSLACQAADLDTDGDVDQDDFGIFQRCYSGARRPADPNCAN